MTSLILSPITQSLVNDYLTSPGQALGLIGEKWLEKTLIAEFIAEKLLHIDEGSINNYPYYLNVGVDIDKSVTIEDIRQVSDFLMLKVPNRQVISRVVIIARADRMTIEAQNALLKNLEEPPNGTVFILTAETTNSLLPTIISRLHNIKVFKPAKNKLSKYYQREGYNNKEIDQALLISSGLPGLMRELMTKEDNPISVAAGAARELLSSTTFERLASIDKLTKDKSQLRNILFVIKQMAGIGINSENPQSADRWKKILSATTDTEYKLSTNAQAKLTLTNYMLSIS